VDPLKVARAAPVDASGVASLLTTSEACVMDAPEEEKAGDGGRCSVPSGHHGVLKILFYRYGRYV
jgi:hypothetical protein